MELPDCEELPVLLLMAVPELLGGAPLDEESLLVLELLDSLSSFANE